MQVKSKSPTCAAVLSSGMLRRGSESLRSAAFLRMTEVGVKASGEPVMAPPPEADEPESAFLMPRMFSLSSLS